MEQNRQFPKMRLRTHLFPVCNGILTAMVLCVLGCSLYTILGTTALLVLYTVCMQRLLRTAFDFPAEQTHGIGSMAVAIAGLLIVTICSICLQACLPMVAIAVVLAIAAVSICMALPDWERRLPVILTVLGLLIGLLTVWQNRGCYSPDSYSYYDISRTFGNTFGKVQTIRQYVVRSDYNCSFPYGYPLCLRGMQLLTGLDLPAGVLFNCLLMPISAVLLLAVSKRLTGSTLCGALFSFLLCTNVWYLNEIYAARSIPLSILLTMLAGLLCWKLCKGRRHTLWCALATGLLVGYNWMTRFDQVSLAAFLTVMLLLFAPKGLRVRTALCYLAGVGLMVLPWSVYSLRHFDSLFFSDNNGTAWMLQTQVPNYVFLPDSGTETIWQMPLAWLRVFGKRLTNTFATAWTDLALCAAVLAAFALVLLLDFGKKYGKASSLKEVQSHFVKVSSRNLYCGLLIFLYCIGKLFMYALVGYITRRYYVESIVLGLFLCGTILYRAISPERKRMTAYVAYGVIVYLFFTSSTLGELCMTRKNPQTQTAWLTQLEQVLQEQTDAPDTAVLMVGRGVDDFLFGVQSQYKVYVSPNNPSVETVAYVLQTYVDADWIVLERLTEDTRTADEDDNKDDTDETNEMGNGGRASEDASTTNDELQSFLTAQYSVQTYDDFYLFDLRGEG